MGPHELFRAAPEPLGYDFHAVRPDGPGAAGSVLLRLEPWRCRSRMR